MRRMLVKQQCGQKEMIARNRCRRFCCSVTFLLAWLYILFALAKIVCGVLIVTRVYFSQYISYSIIVIINFSFGCLILASGIIWVISTLQPVNRHLNGVNLGFSIFSLLSISFCIAVESIIAIAIRNCQSPNDCKRKIIHRRFCYSLLTFSGILLFLSIGNVILSSMKCCCSGSTGVAEESGHVISMDTTAYSINEDENQSVHPISHQATVKNEEHFNEQ